MGPQFFLWFLVGIDDSYLKVFCLTRVPHSWPFGEREQALVGAFLSVPIGISRFLPSAPSTQYVSVQKENPGT